jgi:hypothetical protein
MLAAIGNFSHLPKSAKTAGFADIALRLIVNYIS